MRSADRAPPEEVSTILMVEVVLEPKEGLGINPWNIQRGGMVSLLKCCLFSHLA